MTDLYCDFLTQSKKRSDVISNYDFHSTLMYTPFFINGEHCTNYPHE